MRNRRFAVPSTCGRAGSFCRIGSQAPEPGVHPRAAHVVGQAKCRGSVPRSVPAAVSQSRVSGIRCPSLVLATQGYRQSRHRSTTPGVTIRNSHVVGGRHACQRGARCRSAVAASTSRACRTAPASAARCHFVAVSGGYGSDRDRPCLEHVYQHREESSQAFIGNFA